MNELLEWLDKRIEEELQKSKQLLSSHDINDKLMGFIIAGNANAFLEIQAHIKTKAAETELMDTEETE